MHLPGRCGADGTAFAYVNCRNIGQATKEFAMTIKERNVQKKWLTCIRCGKRIWTDRCHRYCRRCRIAVERLDYRIPSSFCAAYSDVSMEAFVGEKD